VADPEAARDQVQRRFGLCEEIDRTRAVTISGVRVALGSLADQSPSSHVGELDLGKGAGLEHTQLVNELARIRPTWWPPLSGGPTNERPHSRGHQLRIHSLLAVTRQHCVNRK